MKDVLKIGIPAMMDSLVAVVVTTIDTRMISVLGPAAVYAVSFTTQPKLILFAVFFALGATTSIFVAQAYGRNDAEEANAAFHMILRISVVLAVILGILSGSLARPIMHLCNHQADTVEMSVIFFRIIMVCMVFQHLSVIINSALRGTDSRLFRGYDPAELFICLRRGTANGSPDAGRQQHRGRGS